MNKIYSILFCISLALLSCQTQDADRLQFDDSPTVDTELSGVEGDITVNILASRYGGYKKGEKNTRALGDFTLTPYVVEGDTLLYVAQYADGWEIYSASHATNMLLFSSPEGIFDMEDPNLPPQLKELIKSNAEAISEISSEKTEFVDPSWGSAALSDEKVREGDLTENRPDGTRSSVKASDLPPGEWILLDCEEIKSETYVSPKLIQTKWGQQAPWNAYAPFCLDRNMNEVQAVAGCTPVAVAQYMYFTHFKDGVPTKCVSQALKQNGSYNFYAPNEEIWNTMARNYYEYKPRLDASALLIGYTGKCLKSSYGIEATSTKENNCLEFLSNTYGTQFTRTEFKFSLIENSIKEKGYPLIAYAESDQTSDGESCTRVSHSFLIDQYKQISKTYRYTYGLKRDPLPPGMKDKWIGDLTDADGNIIKYAYTSELEVVIPTNFVSMNWGWEEQFDRVLYSALSGWSAGGQIYNLNHFLYVRND